MVQPRSEPPPLLDDVGIHAFVTAAASLSGLAIAPEWRDAVTTNLKATAAAARLVLAFQLPDDLDAAPVFVA